MIGIVYSPRAMKLFAVLLKGINELQYFEADYWKVEENGTVEIGRYKDAKAIAMFPSENLLEIVDLTARAHLTDSKAQEKLKAFEDTKSQSDESVTP
jgi:hypothetical protein